MAYNAAMSACGGAWPHALALLQSVPHELGADAVSFGSVISACEKSHWDVGFQAQLRRVKVC